MAPPSVPPPAALLGFPWCRARAGTDVAAERRHLVCLGGERPRGAGGSERDTPRTDSRTHCPGAAADAGEFADGFADTSAPFIPILSSLLPPAHTPRSAAEAPRPWR